MPARPTGRGRRGRALGLYVGLFVAGFAATAALVPLPLSSSATPDPPHVMIVMMENEGYGQVLGDSSMPFTNSLATDYGVATQSFALAHPSLPNYLDLYSGSDQGVTQDEPPSSSGIFDVPTLATQLASAGFTMAAYAEDLPSDPSNDSGTYVVHHNPWEYFTNPPPLADASTLVSDLNSATPPDFVWCTPNEIDDGDSGAPQATVLQDEDSFLSSFVPEVQGTSWYHNGGQIVIEWDEALDSDTSGINGGAGGHVATIVVSAALKASPQQDTTPVDTTGVLHSIEDEYGLAPMGGSAADGTIDSLLTRASPAAAPTTAPAPISAPAPAPAPAAPATTAPPTTPTTHPAPAPTSKPAPPTAPATVSKPVSATSTTTTPPKTTAPETTPSKTSTAPKTRAPNRGAGRTGVIPPVLAQLLPSVPTAVPPALGGVVGSLHGSSPSRAATELTAHRGSTGTTATDLGLTDAPRPGGPDPLLLAATFLIGLFTVAMAATAWNRGRRGAHSAQGRRSRLAAGA